jgi:hypothetical protein
MEHRKNLRSLRNNPHPDLPADSASAEREKIRLVVPPKQAKERLDVYLTHQVQNATRNKVQQALRTAPSS